MSMMVVDDSIAVSGSGWKADVHSAYVLLAVEPDATENTLHEAVHALVSPSRLRFWTVSWVYEDAHGWDVYALERT